MGPGQAEIISSVSNHESDECIQFEFEDGGHGYFGRCNDFHDLRCRH